MTIGSFFKSAALAATIAAAAIALPAQAGTADNASMTRLMTDKTQITSALFVLTNVTPTSRPACSSSTAYYFVLDIGTDLGKSMMAQLLTAYGLNKQVKIIGTNACTINATVEDISRIEVY